MAAAGAGVVPGSVLRGGGLVVLFGKAVVLGCGQALTPGLAYEFRFVRRVSLKMVATM